LRIALWNASGLDNLGDLILDRVNRIEIAKRLPEAKFVTYCPWPIRQGVEKLSIDHNGRWSGEGRFDAIVIGGGALLMGPPFSHPGLQTFFFGGYPDRFRDKAICIWNAVCSDSRVASPAVETWARYVRNAAARCHSITVRNSQTLQYLRHWGVQEEIEIVPDPAILAVTPVTAPANSSAPITVGWLAAQPEFPAPFIEIMRSSALADFSDANPSVVRLTASAALGWSTQGASDHVLHLIKGIASSTKIRVAALDNMYGDSSYAETIYGKIEGHFLDYTRLGERLDPLTDWMESVDCIIASRLHHCIFAVAMGMPVIALDLYYSENARTSKLREFMFSSGLGDHYLASNLTMAEDGKLDDLIQIATSNRGIFREAAVKSRQAANLHFDKIADCIATLSS
jgi:polysaccharide pyruvyl transferase WcaK-like protein